MSNAAIASAVISTIRNLANSNGRVSLTEVRKAVWADRAEVDAALLDLQDADQIVLYRNDRSASLTPADHAAALEVGGCPRHLAYLA